MPIQIEQSPKNYSFQIGGFIFQCQPPFVNPMNKHPIDILIIDLENIIQELRNMERFEIKESIHKGVERLISLKVHSQENCVSGCPDLACKFSRRNDGSDSEALSV